MDKKRFDYLVAKSKEILELEPEGARALTEAVMGDEFRGGFLAGFWFYEQKALRGGIEGIEAMRVEDEDQDDDEESY